MHSAVFHFSQSKPDWCRHEAAKRCENIVSVIFFFILQDLRYSAYDNVELECLWRTYHTAACACAFFSTKNEDRRDFLDRLPSRLPDRLGVASWSTFVTARGSAVVSVMSQANAALFASFLSQAVAKRDNGRQIKSHIIGPSHTAVRCPYSCYINIIIVIQ